MRSEHKRITIKRGGGKRVFPAIVIVRVMHLLVLDICMTMSYICYMVFFDKDVQKDIKKKILPEEIAKLFYNAFCSLNQTKDLNLFDIKKLLTNSSKDYYRLRKGKYRVIFTIEEDDFYVLTISKRAEVYKKWQ
jgi:mRNA interferase RelE/StbE